MSENLFNRANRIGLLNIKEWLPDGREEAGEWVAKNPTRDDRQAGSFKVSLSSGKWIDNATDEAGGDAVSLFAYLFAGRCEREALAKSTHVQVEAARAILLDHDASYFPSDDDSFKRPTKHEQKADFWSAFRWAGAKQFAEIPEFDVSWYEERWGKLTEQWDFYDGKKFVFRVARFIQGTTKSDRPFTIWTGDGQTRWRSKAPEGTYPLYNRNELEDRPSDEVIVTEGQKAASRGSTSVYNDSYVFVGWYGGANNSKLTDWTPLRGRNVWFWPDSDSPGRQAIQAMREIADTYDINLKIVYPPSGVKKGWDVADALAEGRNLTEILLQSADKPAQTFLDDNVYPFKIIGTAGEDIVFYPFGSNRIKRYREASLTKNALLTLGPMTFWYDHYQDGRKGIAWDAAIDDIIRRSESTPVFDFTKVRGSGAWIDGDEVVINTGENLIVDGQSMALHERTSHYVYEKQSYIPYRIENPMDTESATHLLDVCRKIQWTNKAAPYALAGWLMLAPWGGILKWRPHLWVVGPKGTGKSWVLDNIVGPMVVKEYGERGDGTSTPAGVRQRMQSSSRPFVADEMESDTGKYTEYIDQILKLFRGASSGGGDGGITLLGNVAGDGQQYIMQSMACFASIGAAISQGADQDRFTKVELKKPRKGDNRRREEFDELSKMATVLTSEWARSFHARTYQMIAELLHAVDVCVRAAEPILRTRRSADQIGTLLAAAWLIEHDRAPSAAEANQWFKEINIIDLLASDSEEKDDEEMCLDEILASRVDIQHQGRRQQITVGRGIEILLHTMKASLTEIQSEPEEQVLGYRAVQKELEMIGIIVKKVGDTHEIRIAVNHPPIRMMLMRTAWAQTYTSMLLRLDSCIGEVSGPMRFGGASKKYVKLNGDMLFDFIEDGQQIGIFEDTIPF